MTTGLKFTRISEFESQPPQAWIIDGILPERAIAMLYGPSTVGKSFVTLDWSNCIATGRDWQSRKVKQGGVAYIYAEGDAGVGKRVRAWRQHNAYTGELDVWLLPGSVQLMNEEAVNDLILELQSLPIPPAMVVVDTLHQNMAGGDENAAKDSSIVMNAAKRIRDALRATVLIIHHTGWDTKHLRGSSSLFAALDVIFGLRAKHGKKSPEILLEAEKQRDDASVALDLKRVTLTLADGQTSCVITSGEPSGPVDFKADIRKILAVFAVTPGETLRWKDALEQSGLPETTFERSLRELIELDMVLKESRGVYALTDYGQRWLEDEDTGPARANAAA